MKYLLNASTGTSLFHQVKLVVQAWGILNLQKLLEQCDG